jgi:hypothetical protein
MLAWAQQCLNLEKVTERAKKTFQLDHIPFVHGLCIPIKDIFCMVRKSVL